MMNNYDEKTLLKQLEQLENENTKLKVENQELKNKLEAHDLIDEDYNKPVSLNDYYLSKYLDTHDEIYKKRINQIFSVCSSLQEEINELTNELATLKESDTNMTLEETKEAIEKLECEKEELDQVLQVKIIELTDLIKEINKMLIDAKRYAVEYYNNLVMHLGKASNESTLEYMDFILSVVKNSFYDQNVHINNEMIKASYLNKELEDLDKSTEIAKKQIDEKIKNLSVNHFVNGVSHSVSFNNDFCIFDSFNFFCSDFSISSNTCNTHTTWVGRFNYDLSS